MKKVILAYSGGLDTTCCIKWLKDKGFKVICFSADLGGEFSSQDLKRRAIKSGAEKIYIKDLKREFAYEYILPSLKASCLYEKKYVLSTALGRPLIAKYLVEIAKKEKAKFVAHGCTGKGNDQVRFEVSISILNPKLKIIAPLREWELSSREEEIAYAKKHKLPIKISKEKIYSIDANIWGISIEGGRLEDLDKEPLDNSYYLTQPLKETQDKEFYVEIEFDRGTPIKLNGKRMDLVKLIRNLNFLGKKASIGRTDLIEDRLIGIKSREVYEAPAAWILHTAHQELENLTLDREVLFFKELIAQKYAQLIYQGLWFTHLKKCLDEFVEATQEKVIGKIGLKLYKGNIVMVKRESPHSLYKKEFATYGEKDKFDRKIAEGFIKIWGLPYKL
jgi:argininosuccinate synthase